MVFWTGCAAGGEEEGLEGVTEIGTSPLYDIVMELDQTFGGQEDDLIGRMGDVSVDDQGRVFIADGQGLMIHMFDENGGRKGSFGESGDGPGEFRSVGSIEVRGGRLYALDQNRQMIHVYSVDGFHHEETINLDFSNREVNPDIETERVSGFSVRSDDELLLQFGKMHDAEDRELLYYILKDGETLADQSILEVQDVPIFADRSGDIPVSMLLPFSRRTLVAHGHNSEIFSAWTEDFKIKRHDPDGRYEETLSVSFENLELNRRDVIEGYSDETMRRVVSNAEFPDTWPVMSDLLTDDENRLWVSTIVEDADIYEWWVLEDNGELMAMFEWPRDQPIVVIKDGKIYTRETDEDTGLQQVVRYRIKIGDQNA